jgi:glutaredoxin/organic radical activating enzyme
MNTIYSATGCARCKITKNYLKDNSIEYEEFDFKAEGKDAFNTFYRANRKNIFRDKDGVEFPVFTDGEVIRQGVSVIIGYLMAKDELSGFIGRSELHGEWIDGFDVSGGDPARASEFLSVLSFLKKNGLKIQLTSDGRNPELLEMVVEKGLADKLIVEVGNTDIAATLKQATRVSDYQFITIISPRLLEDNTVSYMTPAEVGDIAKKIEEATGSKKHPYKLRVCNLEEIEDDRLKDAAPLAAADMFKYRTAARRYMVMTEI